ncbi:histone acetyltransferase KAT2B-like isoform X3 [Vanacampus margaritifer]
MLANLEKNTVWQKQVEGACKCNGWKSQNPPATPPRSEQQQPAAGNLRQPCRSCSHALGDHVSHQERVPEDEVNRLLDVEYLYTCVDKEEDADTKQVYFSLFKLLRKCILQMGKPTLEAQESPPFKRPGIEQHQTIAELAKMSLNQINFWQPETPSQGLQRLPNHDQQAKLPPEKRTLILTHFPKSETQTSKMAPARSHVRLVNVGRHVALSGSSPCWRRKSTATAPPPPNLETRLLGRGTRGGKSRPYR